jgi:hypothetical protein
MIYIQLPQHYFEKMYIFATLNDKEEKHDSDRNEVFPIQGNRFH